MKNEFFSHQRANVKNISDLIWIFFSNLDITYQNVDFLALIKAKRLPGGV
jgi:hypothetical protein